MEEVDSKFEWMWKQGKNKRRALKNAKFYSETFPKELNQLARLAEAFSKIKLNDRGLPW